MTVGYHAPLPPAPSGVADYAATLAEALGRHVELSINPIDPCDVELYHLGNNQLHRPIYRKLMKRPGVLVLHDAVLHHFFLGAMPEEMYVEEFVHNYGEWSREEARELWRNRARSAQDPRHFRYPMLGRVGQVARAIVVHNPAAARMVREHAEQATVVEIPHLFQKPAPPDPVEVTRLRVRLGVPPSAPFFGVFGYLRESKRLLPILRAFERVRRQIPEAALLVAGRMVSTDLERSTADKLAADGVHRAGHLPEEEFWLHAHAIDIGLNLRHPAAGETSGIGIRLMGIGKAVAVTTGEETSRFPESSCARIDPGPAEEEMLFENMLWLAKDTAARRLIGQRAAAHIAAEHSSDRCAAQYLETLRSVATASRQPASSTRAPAPSPRPDPR